MNHRPIRPTAHLIEVLREQGETPEDAEKLGRELRVLDEWQAPIPTSLENEQIMERLMKSLARPSPIRAALHKRSQGAWGEWVLLLNLMRAQISLLGGAFWLTSAMVILMGCLLVQSETNINRAAVLQIFGPLLSYIGATSVFRGIGLNMLELELSCPPSPRQLTIARLVIVLGYDICLCLAASFALSRQGGEQLLEVTLHWMAPLLLVFGLTLLLSFRIPLQSAAAIVYALWLGFLLISILGTGILHAAGGAFSTLTEGIFGLLGLALLLLAAGFTPVASIHIFARRR